MASNLTPSTNCSTSSFLTCPMTLRHYPSQHSACAALLECLSNTRATDAMETQYKTEFQYGTTAFMVMASLKGGRHPFDPHQIDLPSIPVLIAFYHACLVFPVKELWLEAIKAGNCDTFAELTYSNVACYCPDADETILGHLAQMLHNVRLTKPIQLTPCSSPSPAIKTPAPPANASWEVFLHVYPICLSQGQEPHSTTSFSDKSR